ncbi:MULTISPECIES: aminotransferase class I/II-fold pyridoxal phosphate-dependent enzyme [Chryseobacterium]|uniref:Methionine aminotransferase n=1 Tax=Chryseobacterium camelliae TaxID=1265445 RepID=A0ABU0TIG7_9FLAO|nr:MULTISPECIES: aminotransferase class I/II-fold pyridoxal phosphate-dependent enzyme [Chryseobacterium]MDT3406147.1 methionine aminotransferase [Pseudacidovorax intermedius]MDQ1096050.1 methionine aminotransferase [Chryseobacterium camelliae]MDQ1099986.1 methionine aminotransferase [Chryseobacterium sp. SORGH_AS_1048]MDR6087332.1 methionine aminotransferase [Chryseobacterium sp. SORGH_AS_0909]MDR6131707.1 methionine aminotransferase [Chryseobacterium sp. SORGH_AS_1175]
MKKIYRFSDYSFFTEMSELARKNNSFDLSLGLPDFDIDERLKYYLKESAESLVHQYEPLSGNPSLIQNIIRFNSDRKNGINVNENEISIIPCATFALHTALKTVLNPGDEVVIIQPSYYTYGPSVVMNGGIPVYYEPEADFCTDWDRLKCCISLKTKAVIVNSPQNPTGKIWSQADWSQLYNLIADRNIYLISEEIYDLYCYDGTEHYSSFLHPELRKRTFCIFSFGKMFHCTGWKVSYMLAPEDLTTEFRFHQQYLSYGANAPAQYALSKYLDGFDFHQHQGIMQHKRDLFNALIADTPLYTDHPCEGSVFQTVNFRHVSKTMTDVEFSKWLTAEKQVACLPLSAFYHLRQNSDYIRFSFLKKDETIIQAMEHLKKVL